MNVEGEGKKEVNVDKKGQKNPGIILTGLSTTRW